MHKGAASLARLGQNLSPQQLIGALVERGELTDPGSPRGRLLNVAARQFEQKGYARTTVRDIASEVGILSGSIFHHFASKEQILCAVMREVTIFASARMRSAMQQAESPRDKLRACIQSELEAIHGQAVPGFSILVLEWRSLSKDSRKEVLRLRDEYEHIWLIAIRAAKCPGGDAALVRRLLVGALSHTYSWFKPRGKGLSIAELADRILLIFAP
ncbi:MULTISPECIES: TetR/AcrR family transcriptional regulator [unclassified Microbulbifer]|uniref:TetR/AcrR family transcriptional regulator n=1 Tax=Microbulbifer spongiae TaxID=2944933 RepID=A0ABY9E822_9GAMM|nr:MULTISPECIES: TetR/AcrR family transcriptional regulator [unclassified Microbulbifer]MDP5208924.1 TetR/AcrR family transcriptional regulator [Microbulbifer sp. 2205BS26-8]WKD48292.1 TetR/AcrR family transcriptional regulator [Microbulbifer sp. MI-G]